MDLTPGRSPRLHCQTATHTVLREWINRRTLEPSIAMRNDSRGSSTSGKKLDSRFRLAASRLGVTSWVITPRKLAGCAIRVRAVTKYRDTPVVDLPRIVGDTIAERRNASDSRENDDEASSRCMEDRQKAKWQTEPTRRRLATLSPLVRQV